MTISNERIIKDLITPCTEQQLYLHIDNLREAINKHTRKIEELEEYKIIVQKNTKKIAELTKRLDDLENERNQKDET